MVVYLGEWAKLTAIDLLERLHKADIRALLAFGDRSLKSQLKSADRVEARYTIILGEEELKIGKATVRDMTSSQQGAVSLDGIVSWLQAQLAVGLAAEREMEL